MKRSIELLAPAKNLECGIEAVNHGADAVYIGAPRFGARAAAGNSLEDIAALVEYAHVYGVKVYVAVNTILHDDELKDTEDMIWDLYRAGVDALIVQDMGITGLNLPPIPLHASTQTDNRSAQKVDFLTKVGFSQVVLARELSAQEIAEIHAACPDTRLEVFVHGALCVSYSGQCYVSQSCYGRSANRGECAQFCRLSFDLVDSDGKVIDKGKHFLSLKDMNQSENLEEIIDAGATSLKIEGRLKDVSYVKNVTAYYRTKLDELFRRRKDLVRASSGSVKLMFVPQLDKSFSRGFTDYFLHGRNKDIFSFNTPKSLGEEMGMVKEIRGNSLNVAGVKPFNNGDGICYIDDNGRLQGFRVNRVENNRLFLQERPRVKPKTVLYRNFDSEFEKVMQKKSAERKIGVDITLSDNNFGFSLTMRDEDGVEVSVTLQREKELARSPQSDNLRNQLGKLGNTPFEAKDVRLDLDDNWFIPISELSELRRCGVEKLLSARKINYRREIGEMKETSHVYPLAPIGSGNVVSGGRKPQDGTLTYLGNVLNGKAVEFYRRHGVKTVLPALEKEEPEGAVLMFCKHCIRYSMGWCPVRQKRRSPYREPYYLVSTDGRRFRLDFDCKQCMMKVSAAGSVADGYDRH